MTGTHRAELHYSGFKEKNMRLLLASTAAIALIATGAVAQGNGNRGGNNQDRVDHSAHQQGGGSEMRGNRGGSGNANADADRGNDQRGNQQPGNDQRGNSAAREDRGNGGQQRAEAASPQRGNQGGGNQGNGNANRIERAAAERGEPRGAIDAGRNAVARARIERDNAGRGEWRDAPTRYIFDGDRRDRDVVRYVGLVNGCPPGLAAKRNGCQPPGQARKNRYFVRDDYGLNWWGLPRYDDRRYRYDSGYLLRLRPDGGIAGYIPLLGGALTIGNVWPQYYGYSEMSPYYSRYYGLGPTGSYRFADNVVYRVDPQTSAINAVAALLTGDQFTVGQRIPAGYDVYNVPYSYRDRYVDGPDAYYRYSDGYIYQVDPETRLVAAAIELLVS
jgi:hypothetical protein